MTVFDVVAWFCTESFLLQELIASPSAKFSSVGWKTLLIKT